MPAPAETMTARQKAWVALIKAGPERVLIALAQPNRHRHIALSNEGEGT